MKAKYIFIGLLTLGFASCSVEAPFGGETQNGTGQFSKANLSLNVLVDDNVKINRATRGSEDLIDDFEIIFTNTGTNQIKSFSYGEMPEVVSLEAGNYTIKAQYGKDLIAEWDNPHFLGSAGPITIVADKINTEAQTISCSLQNVMVSVNFDNDLLDRMTGDPEVEVYVNNEKSLVFTKQHSIDETPGYFKHYDVCTLTAKFSGTVDGVALEETKTLKDINPGNHYKLTFSLHLFDGKEEGYDDLGITVDAKVDVSEIATNVDIEEQKPLDDVTFPTEDPIEGEGPGEGDNNPEVPETEGPSVDLDNRSTVEFGKVNDITPDTKIILNVKSNDEEGLSKFLIEIDSEAPDLASMSNMDLINVQESEVAALQSLGLLPEGKTTLKGEKELVFDISDFMDILCGCGAYTHTFTMTIGDATGEKVLSLTLNVPE